MSVSDDDEDFLSADEGNSGDENNIGKARKSLILSEMQLMETTRGHSPKSFSIIASDSGVGAELDRGKEASFGMKAKIVDLVEDESPNEKMTKKSPLECEKPDCDEEEALAERIRERNLRIARKFSAEIAKSVKASSPIPVKSSGHMNVKQTDNQLESSEVDPKLSLPPAPPPTPALSSSFSNAEDPSSQFGWRMPKSKGLVKPNEKPDKNTATTGAQARLALDRLSELTCHTDSRNLFERVADDLKRVTIGSNESSENSEVQGQIGTSIQSIAELGNTISSWGFSGASKLLASASQVTSQVGTVFDSVGKLAQQTIQSPSSDVEETNRRSGEPSSSRGS